MRDDDDTADPTTPSNGHGHASVPGGELGVRLRDVEARLVALDSRDTEQHATLVQRLDALTKGVEVVGGQVVERLDAMAEEHRRTVTLRVLGVAERVAERVITPTAAPLYAAAVLVVAVALAGSRVQWGDLSVGAQRASANADSDEGGDMPASVGAGGVSPEPAP